MRVGMDRCASRCSAGPTRFKPATISRRSPAVFFETKKVEIGRVAQIGSAPSVDFADAGAGTDIKEASASIPPKAATYPLQIANSFRSDRVNGWAW